MKFEIFYENIKKVVAYKLNKDEKKVEDKEIAILLNMNPKSFTQNKSAGTIPYKYVDPFCESEGINLNWLLYNRGEMLIENDTNPYTNPYAKKIANYIEEGYAPEKFVENVLNTLNGFKQASLRPSF